VLFSDPAFSASSASSARSAVIGCQYDCETGHTSPTRWLHWLQEDSLANAAAWELGD